MIMEYKSHFNAINGFTFTELTLKNVYNTVLILE